MKAVNDAQKKESKESISKDMTIGDIVKKYPEAVDVFLKHGLHCVGCSVSYWETVEQGCIGHGMSDSEITKMVDEANKAVSKSLKELKNDDNSVHITAKAAQKAKDFMKASKKQGQYLRIGVVEGGCSGASYSFNIDAKANQDDEVIEKNGLKVLIDKKSMESLKGARVDYVESLQGAGFKIDNPNARHTCGCGSSFS